ncbi:hypothetical protein M9458_045960, partial [Cirrhinus mrigala]
LTREEVKRNANRHRPLLFPSGRTTLHNPTKTPLHPPSLPKRHATLIHADSV